MSDSLHGIQGMRPQDALVFRDVCKAEKIFFFFQAEDGIRDFHVTGVQTCALPISWAYTAAVHGGFNPLLLLSPNVARALHEFGVDKPEIRTYLYDQLRIRADVTERYAHQVGRSDFSFAASIRDPVLRESWVA